MERLTSATGSYGSLTYSYDQIGNLLSNSRVSPSTYTYPASGSSSVRPHAVSTAGGNTYTYDANGNMISGAGRTISYDYENRPTSVTQSGTTTTFVYDGDGGRVKKTVGTATTTYIGKLYVCEGTSCAKLIFAGGQRIAMKQGTSGSISYFHADHLGSTSVLTNGSGTIEENLVYYPYGDTYTNTGTADVAYKYTGKERDTSTGLYFYEARYYDAALGRFISSDTIVPDPNDPQAFNRYAYVLNNPLRYTDPTGKSPLFAGGGFDIILDILNFNPGPFMGSPAELVTPDVIAGPFPINGIYTLPTVTVTNTAIPPVSVLPPIGSPFLNPFDLGVGNNLPFITFDPSIVFDSQGHAVATAAQEALQPVLSPADLLNVGKAGFSIGAGIIGGGLKIVGKQALISNQFKVLDRANKKLKEIAQKFGKNSDELLQEILSKGKLFKDLRTKNQGNISVILERPDGRGFLRATFDPDGKTLKSVGLNRPEQIPNLIQKGDIVPLE